MNSRERFTQTMNYMHPDRPPLFEDGIREEVIKRWRTQGLGKRDRLESWFTFDVREELEPILEPLPTPSHWPKTPAGLQQLSNKLNAEDPKRLPDDWGNKVNEWKNRQYPLILRVHRGYFLTMGVHGWNRFTDAIQNLIDRPNMIEMWMDVYSDFCAKLITKILQEVDVDAALFSEPIGGNHGPLISPGMYSSLVLRSYIPILDTLKRFGVSTIIYRTYANTRLLLPSVIDAGFNCLWACECQPQAMNYQEIRREFGKDLRLIGGIDADCLRQNESNIQEEIMEIVPQLLEGGGYLPLADGRVREDVPFKNYIYYRKILESVTS